MPFSLSIGKGCQTRNIFMKKALRRRAEGKGRISVYPRPVGPVFMTAAAFAAGSGIQRHIRTGRLPFFYHAGFRLQQVNLQLHFHLHPETGIFRAFLPFQKPQRRHDKQLLLPAVTGHAARTHGNLRLHHAGCVITPSATVLYFRANRNAYRNPHPLMISTRIQRPPPGLCSALPQPAKPVGR